MLLGLMISETWVLPAGLLLSGSGSEQIPPIPIHILRLFRLLRLTRMARPCKALAEHRWHAEYARIIGHHCIGYI
eukprot:s3748_g12.t1